MKSASRILTLAVFFALVLVGAPMNVGASFAQGSLPGPSPQTQTATQPPAKVTAPQQRGPSSITDTHYRLGIGDKLRITVYGEEDLSGEFVVDSTGQVQLPLIGTVRAAALTISEFNAEIHSSLVRYLQDPRINIEVLNYRPFYILGEVNKPGEYPFENGLTALSAVALAGGYTYRANEDEVYVRHEGEKMERTLPADGSTRIMPGDIVRIPERFF